MAAVFAISPAGAPRIARKIEAGANRTLSAVGFPEASARADGRRVTLYFSGGDLDRREAAANAVSALAAVARVDVVEIKPPPPVGQAPAIADSSPQPSPSAPDVELAAGEPAQPAPALETAPTDTPRVPDPDGCRLAINRVVLDRRLTFGSESTRLSAADIGTIETLAAAMEPCGGLRVAVEGHTDATGSQGANLRISEKRATAVAEILAPLRPDVEFVIRPYGEERPIASNRTLEGRAANRRIDFSVEEPAAAESE